MHKYEIIKLSDIVDKETHNEIVKENNDDWKINNKNSKKYVKLKRYKD
jgi:hypothetical protein